MTSYKLIIIMFCIYIYTITKIKHESYTRTLSINSKNQSIKRIKYINNKKSIKHKYTHKNIMQLKNMKFIQKKLKNTETCLSISL